MKRPVTSLLVISLLVLFFLPNSAIGNTYYVPDDFTRIQDALDSAVGGDVVVVRDGIYSGDGNKLLDFGGKALTLRSENGPANCTISGGGYERGAYFHNGESADSIIDGFTFVDCHPSTNGGAIYCYESSPSIMNCVFDGNRATDCGGAIRCRKNSAPTISNCTFKGNSGTEGGAIYCIDSSYPAISNCLFVENQATNGGAISCINGSYPEMIHCTFSKNTATKGGSIYALQDSSPSIIDGILWDNWASIGQEIALEGNSSVSVSFSDVEGGQESVLVGLGCTLDWSDGNIDKDPFFVGGGDYHLTGSSPCIDRGTEAGITDDIDGDARPSGGGFDIGCDEVVAIYVPDDYPTIRAALQAVPEYSLILLRDGVYSGKNNRNLSFSGKIVRLKSENGPDNCIIDCGNVIGGFVFWAGETNEAVLDGVTIINGNAGFGGGIYCVNSSPTIRNCVIKDSSSAYGGGICLSSSSAQIINCTIVGNSGDYGAGGIFLYNSDAAAANCTISDNTAISGGGVFCFSSTPTFTNCIITGNTATYGPQILLSTFSDMTVSYSNIEGGQADAYLELDSHFSWGGGNFDSDPLFAGGGDYHLSYNSPCVDNGLDMGILTDVEGDSRPIAGRCDIGSDEFSSVYYIPDDYSNIRQAINNAPDNCTIVVRNGTYSGPNNRNIAFQNKSVTLKSENGPESCIIDCQGASGAFVFWQGETPDSVLDGFTIINGNAGYGGGIYCVGSSPTIRNCVIKDSTAAYGGGVCLSSSSASLTNVTIAGNTADYGAAGVFCYASDSVLSHCSISDNSAQSGAGIFCFASSPTMTNCIVTGNTATYGPQVLLAVASTLAVNHSDIRGGQAQAYVEGGCSFVWGTGNIDANPLYVGGGDYHLASGSPCIDAGADAGVCRDIDGDARPAGSGYDIGSDEF